MAFRANFAKLAMLRSSFLLDRLFFLNGNPLFQIFVLDQVKSCSLFTESLQLARRWLTVGIARFGRRLLSTVGIGLRLPNLVYVRIFLLLDDPLLLLTLSCSDFPESVVF